jgi:hypothetical protein
VVKNFDDDDDDAENFDVEMKKNQMNVNKKLDFQEKKMDHLNVKVSILNDENEHHCYAINEIHNDY